MNGQIIAYTFSGQTVNKDYPKNNKLAYLLKNNCHSLNYKEIQIARQQCLLWKDVIHQWYDIKLGNENSDRYS